MVDLDEAHLTYRHRNGDERTSALGRIRTQDLATALPWRTFRSYELPYDPQFVEYVRDVSRPDGERFHQWMRAGWQYHCDAVPGAGERYIEHP